MLNVKAAQRSEVSNSKSRSPIAIAIPIPTASEFKSKNIYGLLFATHNTER